MICRSFLSRTSSIGSSPSAACHSAFTCSTAACESDPSNASRVPILRRGGVLEVALDQLAKLLPLTRLRLGQQVIRVDVTAGLEPLDVLAQEFV